jgi:hypothetical protein
MRPQSWQVNFISFPATAQTALDSVKLCVSLSEVDWFRASWNDTPLHLLDGFKAAKGSIIFKLNFHAFFVAALYFYYLYFINSWNQIGFL